MRKPFMIAILSAASLSVGACATDRYGERSDNDRQIGRAAAGAAIGAAAGAAVGAAVGGVGVGEGAAVGAVAGGVIGAATTPRDGRWYRDNRGDCYFVDERGERIYDYGRRC